MDLTFSMDGPHGFVVGGLRVVFRDSLRNKVRYFNAVCPLECFLTAPQVHARAANAPDLKISRKRMQWSRF